MGIIIKRPVSVVAVMTEEFREQLIRESEKNLMNIEENLQKLETEGARQLASVSAQNPQQAALMTQQMDAERQRLKTLYEQLEAKITDIDSIAEGAEFPFQAFEGFVELKMGDNLQNKLGKAVIVMKDWVIREIRES